MSLLSDWIEKKSDKYVSHDLQNEVISIMANQLHRDLVRDISNSFFSTIADEYTDVSNNQQLVICLRWIDQNLDAHKDFLGFYHIPNIAASTITLVIKDVLVRLQLSLSQSQCCPKASAMMGQVTCWVNDQVLHSKS